VSTWSTTSGRATLPRKADGTPLIGDSRNDENLVVAQLHVAFPRFHNAAVAWVRDHEPERETDAEVFQRARPLNRWTYQWLCVHNYLRTALLARGEAAAAGHRAVRGDAPLPLTRLTAQELRVARAIGEGLSNGEAAASLFLSRKTIESHLTRVYRKLGVRSRSDLARCLARAGMTG
jgi:DNA-binding CsgD family transcriptional regulator